MAKRPETVLPTTSVNIPMPPVKPPLGSPKPTRGQETAADVAALLRARNSVLWIVTREEARVEGYLLEAAGAASYNIRCWDVAQGFTNIDGSPAKNNADGTPARDLESPTNTDCGAALTTIRGRTNSNERCVWVMRDLAPWLNGPIGMTTLRQMRNMARFLSGVERSKAQALIVLTPSRDIPPELSNHATVIEWPLPDREEIKQLLDASITGLPPEIRATAAPNGTRDAAIDAAVGLSGEEASACYARSLVQLRRIDPATVAREKKRVIAREGVMEWFDPLPGGLDAVGGLDNLKKWLVDRAAAYSPAARAYGLPSPKGALLVGIPGCGKSLTAKAIATAWGVPLLRLDLGALKGKFVGESEGNLRKALGVIEAIGRCVVWLDEIEKAMAGATDGAADGGVSQDALGTILSWMQERKGEAFVIATANQVEKLPPELLRKGRFDEIWWIDLPTKGERMQILDSTLATFGRKNTLDNYDRTSIANACEGYTGSEIAALVPEALFTAFADSAREITLMDILDAAKRVVPLSNTMAEKIAKLREWRVGRARPATSATEPVAVKPGNPYRRGELDII